MHAHLKFKVELFITESWSGTQDRKQVLPVVPLPPSLPSGHWHAALVCAVSQYISMPPRLPTSTAALSLALSTAADPCLSPCFLLPVSPPPISPGRKRELEVPISPCQFAAMASHGSYVTSPALYPDQTVLPLAHQGLSTLLKGLAGP